MEVLNRLDLDHDARFYHEVKTELADDLVLEDDADKPLSTDLTSRAFQYARQCPLIDRLGEPVAELVIDGRRPR